MAMMGVGSITTTTGAPPVTGPNVMAMAPMAVMSPVVATNLAGASGSPGAAALFGSLGLVKTYARNSGAINAELGIGGTQAAGEQPIATQMAGQQFGTDTAGMASSGMGDASSGAAGTTAADSTAATAASSGIGSYMGPWGAGDMAGNVTGYLSGSKNQTGTQVGSAVGSAVGTAVGAYFGMPWVGGMAGGALGGYVGGQFKQGGRSEPVSAPGTIGVLSSVMPSVHQGMVNGMGNGRSDQVDAKLSRGEYVVPAYAVSALGDGDNNAGADVLDNWVNNTRQRFAKKVGGLPPPVK